MLPGLRILFAIILLSISVLIFGLGAAAYLRSAHEHFANATIRPIEVPAVARLEQAPATIAMLRVEPESTAGRRDDPVATEAKLAPSPADTATAAITPATADGAQAAADAARAPPEPAVQPVQRETPRPAIVESRPASEPPPAPSAPSVAIETKTPEPAAVPTTVAALGPETREAPPKPERENTPPAAAAPVVAPLDTSVAAPPVSGSDTLKVDDKLIETPKRIAALDEPAAPDVAAKPPDDLKVAAPRVDPAEIEAQRKRLQAQKQARTRAAKARRLAAARARAAAQAKAAAAAPANPFGSPTAGSLTNTPSRSGG